MHLPRFSGTFGIADSVRRDWSKPVLDALQATKPMVDGLPQGADVQFWSYSGDGIPSRAIAYHDLWVRLTPPAGKEEHHFIGDSIELIGQGGQLKTAEGQPTPLLSRTVTNLLQSFAQRVALKK